MRIAVVGSKGLPPGQGGIEHHCAEIYSRMVSQGHRVKVFSRSSYNRLAWNQRFFYRGVQVATLPSIPIRGVDALINSGLAATISSLQAFDIIHFHALGPAVFSWVPRLLSPQTKVIVTCHGLDWQRAKWGSFSTQLLKLGERLAVRYAHKIGVVSEDLQRYFLDAYCCETVCIGNAPATYQAADSEFGFVRSQGLEPKRYILFLGRLVPEKCPDLLIEAFCRLQSVDWKLVFVGGASDTPAYMQRLMNLSGGNPDILFSGELQGKFLAEMVKGAGLFVLPSEVEGLPLALLEAMREGIPVVTSDIPVHRRLLGVDRGLWFEAGSVQACATTLAWAMQNPEFMAQAAGRAQQYVSENYTWDAIATNWLAVYRQALGIAAPKKLPTPF